jgi:hypothetical protein
MARRSSLSLRALVSVSLITLGVMTAACGSVDTGGGGGEGGSAPAPCSTEGAFQSCSLPGDDAGAPSGQQECVMDATDGLVWGTCEVQASTTSTPLVLSFDGAPVTLAASSAAFDLDGTMSVVTDWPAAATPWLALDHNGNGAIDDGSELFGSATVLAGGSRAANGFLALAELDSNGDGQITPADKAWSSLRLWSDHDGDRVSSAGELVGLDARGITAIDLGYASAPRCDLRHNCEVERASFRWVDAAGAPHTGTIIDVHLRHQ